MRLRGFEPISVKSRRQSRAAAYEIWIIIVLSVQQLDRQSKSTTYIFLHLCPLRVLVDRKQTTLGATW